jgi:protein gp37
MNPKEIKTREPFNRLFPIDYNIEEAILEHMKEYGYDQDQPVILWKEENVVVDGHTRLQVAKRLGLEDIPVSMKSFPDELSALKHAIHNQRDRRNFTDIQILACIEIVDKVKQSGERADLASIDARSNKGKSAETTAKIVGTSQAKVERARKVLSDPKEKESVLKGEKTIHKAAQDVKEKTQEKKFTFNKTTESIEWALWTWNPVTGCKIGCPYCYARNLTKRFPDNFPYGFEPHFWEERLDAPKNSPVPKSEAIGDRNVFVCSMADLFGEWVPQEWIDKILEKVRENPQWNFLFLTKNSKRLIEQNWPENCWAGTTVDTQKRFENAIINLEELEKSENRPPVIFISFEPLLEEIFLDKHNLSCVEWIIIGGQSSAGDSPEFQPEWKWVEKILIKARENNCDVYFKPNLKSRPKEYPLKKGI